ncbi:MAG: hypothetical protein AB6733_13165 [Clostridiaceae bacterium]
MNNKSNIITLVVGVVIFFVVISLFIKLLPVIILALAAYWIYRKIRFRKPDKDLGGTYTKKENRDFDFIDADYKDVDEK